MTKVVPLVAVFAALIGAGIGTGATLLIAKRGPEGVAGGIGPRGYTGPTGPRGVHGGSQVESSTLLTAIFRANQALRIARAGQASGTLSPGDLDQVNLSI